MGEDCGGSRPRTKPPKLVLVSKRAKHFDPDGGPDEADPDDLLHPVDPDGEPGDPYMTALAELGYLSNDDE